MADKKSEKKPEIQKPEIKKTEIKKPETKKNKQNKKSSFCIFPVLAFIISLIAILLVGLVWFGQLKNTQAQKKQSNAAQLNQSQQQQILSQLQKQITSQQNLSQQNQKSVSHLINLDNRNGKDWTLAETNYLVRLAILNLSFERNVPSTVVLLKTANQRLASLNDPNLLKARKVLTDNIATLEALPKVDISGILLKLNAIGLQLNKLPLANNILQENNNQKTETKPTTKNKIKSALNTTWSELQKIVVIRHHNKNILPFIAPDQKAYLLQNLQLKLDNAQWAALRQMPNIYQSNLKQAQNWIKDYFNINSSATKSVLANLANLEKINIRPKLPNIDNSLTVLTSGANA